MIATRFDTAATKSFDLHPSLLPDNELRAHHRRPVRQDLWLTDIFGDTVFRCACTNLSAGGLYGTAPLGYGLAVGQRYELRLAPLNSVPGSLLIGDSLGYGTIIRTHLRTEGSEPSVSFALRFDTPQYLPL